MTANKSSSMCHQWNPRRYVQDHILHTHDQHSMSLLQGRFLGYPSTELIEHRGHQPLRECLLKCCFFDSRRRIPCPCECVEVSKTKRVPWGKGSHMELNSLDCLRQLITSIPQGIQEVGAIVYQPLLASGPFGTKNGKVRHLWWGLAFDCPTNMLTVLTWQVLPLCTCPQTGIRWCHFHPTKWWTNIRVWFSFPSLGGQTNLCLCVRFLSPYNPLINNGLYIFGAHTCCFGVLSVEKCVCTC
jgi:hypothetical protein